MTQLTPQKRKSPDCPEKDELPVRRKRQRFFVCREVDSLDDLVAALDRVDVEQGAARKPAFTTVLIVDPSGTARITVATETPHNPFLA
jgi:hypothetical protein